MSENRRDLFEPTVRKEAATRFKRAQPGLRWVGLLTPIAGQSPKQIRIEGPELTLGRDRSLVAAIPDESISRQHARIVRKGDEFILNDLGSFNGTHVEGVPIVSCVLHDGDTIQIGQTLYYFERILESDSSTKGESR